MSSPINSAQSLQMLLKLRPEQLEHFASIARVGSGLGEQELEALREHLCLLDSWLTEGNDDAIRSLLQRLGESDADVSASSGEDGDAARDDLGGTAFLDAAMLSEGFATPATPFAAGAPAVAPPMPPSRRPHPNAGETAMVDAAAIEQAIAAAPGASQLPMSIDDYAGLVAHTEPGGPAATPEGRAGRHLDHGIADEAHRAGVDAMFREHLGRDRQALARYAHKLAEWRRWLQRGGGR